MWKAELRIEEVTSSEMVTEVHTGGELMSLASAVAKRAREISGNRVLVSEAVEHSMVYREGTFVVGFANFWEEKK